MRLLEALWGKTERRVGLAAGVWLTLFFIARGMLDMTELSVGTRVSLALMPVPAFAWFIWEFTQMVSQADELERRIQLEALSVAFPLTLLLLMTLGLLQVAMELNMDDWSYRHIWPIVYIFYVFGLLRARRRYQ